MTTSGIVQTGRPISELIIEAFDYCQVGVEEEGLDAEDYERALRAANFILRDLQAQGIHLWQYTEGVLFLQNGRNNYAINGDVFIEPVGTGELDRYVVAVQSDKLTSGTLLVEAPDFSFEFEVNFNNFYDDEGNFYATRTTPQIGGQLVGWIFGCEGVTVEEPLDSVVGGQAKIFWGVITSDQLGVKDEGGNGRIIEVEESSLLFHPKGSKCYFYPPEATLNNIERVLDCRRTQYLKLSNEIQTGVNFTSHQEQFNLPNRRSSGILNQVTFDRKKEFGVFQVWQPPIDETIYQLSFTFERTFEGFKNTDDTADFPQYWQDAFVLLLAERLCVKFRVPPNVQTDIKQLAAKALNQALNYDNANYDMSVIIDNRTS